MASRILGRRASTVADFEEAFNLERIDLVAEIPDVPSLLRLGRNVVGPRDGLYVLDDEGTFRVYVQEGGIDRDPVTGADFDQARDAAIDRVLDLQGLPFSPPG